MAFLGWLEYDGVEVWFDERVLHYLDGIGCDGAITGEDAGLAASFGIEFGDYPGDGQRNGALRAPWITTIRDTEAFLGGTLIGFIGLALDGAERSPRVRAVTPAVAADGGLPGPFSAGPREIEARVAVVAQDEAGTEAGVIWLADLFTYGRPVPPTGNDPAPPRWGNPARPGGAAAPLRVCTAGAQGGTEAIRTLFDVVLTEGPAVEDTWTLSGGALWVKEVSFTLTAGVPWFYRPARQISGGVGFETFPNQYTGTGPQIVWVMSRDRAAVVRGVETDLDQCGAGPLSGCPDPASVPDPITDVDACAATTPMIARFAPLIDVADQYLPARQECVPVIVVDTGGAIMRRFSVRIARRQGGRRYDTTGAGLLWEINVPFLPANARLILDGRTGTALVHCSGSYLSDPETAIDAPPPASTYEPAVYGIRSGPVVWPVFQGGEDLQITAHAEDDFCSSDAVVSAFLALRTDTA